MIQCTRIASVLAVIMIIALGKLAAQQVSYKPEKYMIPEEGVDTHSFGNRNKGLLWNVYSDRDSNYTYTEPNGKTVKYMANFMEPFFIGGESENYVHLFKDPDLENQSSTERFTRQAESYGWIHKDSLLLWERCLRVPRYGIDKKAIILNSVDIFYQGDLKELKEDTVVFYADPGWSVKTENISHLYNIFYVYKVTDKAVLLGKDMQFIDSKAKEVMWGWVDKNRVTLWNHRVAVEPNWEPVAVAERKNKQKKVLFLLDKLAAKNYADGITIDTEDVFWDDDPYENRHIGDWRRFPVIADTTFRDSSKILTVSVMGQIQSGNSGTKDIVSAADIMHRYQKLRQEKKIINIVFVIDGTTSMNRYIAPIEDAIIGSMAVLEKKYNKLIEMSEKKNTIRFGAVVYRDSAEGERLIESTDLTDNYMDIARFIHAIDPTDTADKDQPEAVYYGIQEALLGMGLSEENLNVIVLVGDAGNHHRERDDLTGVPEDDVINLLSKYFCNLLVFQAHHKIFFNRTYDEFVEQSSRIALKSAIQQYVVYGFEKAAKNFSDNLGSLIMRPDQRWTGDAIVTSGPVISKIIPSPKNDSLNPAIIQSEIENFVLQCDFLVDSIMLSLEKIIEFGISPEEIFAKIEMQKHTENKFVSPYPQFVLAYLMKIFDKEDYDFMLDSKYQFSMVKYAPEKIKTMKYPLLKYVLLFNQKELHGISIIMDELSMASTSMNRREAMQNVWIEILKRHLGDIDRQELLEYDMEKINKKVFGLPGTSGLLKNVKLKDIVDINEVPEQLFEKYARDIKLKNDKLNSIGNKENYEYSFRSQDLTYYWIEEDLLP